MISSGVTTTEVQADLSRRFLIPFDIMAIYCLFFLSFVRFQFKPRRLRQRHRTLNHGSFRGGSTLVWYHATSDDSADKETTLAPSEIGYMLPRSGTCPKSRLDAHRVMYSHVELCSCWLQSLHGMFNLIPLAGAQQVTWPHYFMFRFFENTADVQF